MIRIFAYLIFMVTASNNYYINNKNVGYKSPIYFLPLVCLKAGPEAQPLNNATISAQEPEEQLWVKNYKFIII